MGKRMMEFPKDGRLPGGIQQVVNNTGRTIYVESANLNGKEFLSPEELANYLSIPLSTVYVWRSRGGGPKGKKIGRHVRYRRSDVEAWLEQQ